MKQPSIAVIMANYNGYELTSVAIESIGKIDYSNYKIFVVDDMSSDDSAKKLERNYPEAEVLFTKVNGGLCRAFNTGIIESYRQGFDIFFLVQNDTDDFKENIFKEVLSTFESKSNIGIVGVKVFDLYNNPTWNGAFKNKLGFRLQISEGYFIQRRVFEEIGIYNERLRVYFEDLDLFIRAKQAGFDVVMNPNTSFSHVGQGTFSKQTFKPHFIRIRNIVFFIRQYCGDKSISWKLRNYIRLIRRHFQCLPGFLLRLEFKRFFGQILAIFYGTLVGLVLPWSSTLEKKIQEIEPRYEGSTYF